VKGRNGLIALLLSAVFAWHAGQVLWPAWSKAQKSEGAADFASYYYAVRVAYTDGDPWSKAALGKVARSEDTRRGVHPFLYPPPFLLVTAWIGRLPLESAYRAWFRLDEVLAWVCGGLLWASYRRISPLAAPAVALGFGLLTALPNNHAMGQANLLPLAFVLAGWWAEDEDRPFLAGLLVGTAAMLKMSPALLVFLWMAQRNWRAVGGAIAAAVGLSLATLPLVGPTHQWHFYRDVLPTFSSGGYNGLSVPIELFGNHSIPNLVNHWFPGDSRGMSSTGEAISSAIGIALLATMLWWHRAAAADPLDRSLARSAVSVLALLVPVYTYEHHLVFAVPALVGLFLATERGRFPPAAAAVLGVAATWLWYDLDVIRTTWATYEHTAVGDVLGEVKTASLLLLLVGAGFAGRDR
jgi:hypothetical protein